MILRKPGRDFAPRWIGDQPTRPETREALETSWQKAVNSWGERAEKRSGYHCYQGSAQVLKTLFELQPPFVTAALFLALEDPDHLVGFRGASWRRHVGALVETRSDGVYFLSPANYRSRPDESRLERIYGAASLTSLLTLLEYHELPCIVPAQHIAAAIKHTPYHFPVPTHFLDPVLSGSARKNYEESLSTWQSFRYLATISFPCLVVEGIRSSVKQTENGSEASLRHQVEVVDRR